MDLVCDSCSTRFSKPALKPGDATMCPRCRSLVVAPSAPPPPAPVAAREEAPAVEELEAVPMPGEEPGPEPDPEPGQEPGRPRVSLARACPWCHKRYDVEIAACPRCGYSAARAQILRHEADEETARRASSRHPGRVGWAAVIAGLMLLSGLSRSRSGPGVGIALLVIGLLVYGAWKLNPSSGAAGRDEDELRAGRDRHKRP